MGQSRPLFSLCLSFSHDINQCESIDGVLVTWTQGRQDGRRRRIHWAMAAPLNIFSWPLKDVVRLLGRPLLSTPSSVRIPSTDIFPTFVMSRKFKMFTLSSGMTNSLCSTTGCQTKILWQVVKRWVDVASSDRTRRRMKKQRRRNWSFANRCEQTLPQYHNQTSWM